MRFKQIPSSKAFGVWSAAHRISHTQRLQAIFKLMSPNYSSDKGTKTLRRLDLEVQNLTLNQLQKFIMKGPGEGNLRNWAMS